MPRWSKIPQFPAGFPGTHALRHGNRENSGKLTRKPKVFPASYQGFRGFWFSRGKLIRKTQGFFLHLIGVSGGYKIPNRKTGENPRSYQRSLEKSDSQQESWEKKDLIRVCGGSSPARKQVRILAVFLEKESSLEILCVPILLYSATISRHISTPNRRSLHTTFLN